MQRDSKNLPIFAVRLKEAMQNKTISQKELARLTGVAETQISHYLHGNVTPRGVTVIKLSKPLGVSAGWLMGREGSKFEDFAISMDRGDDIVEALRMIETTYIALPDEGRREMEEFHEYLRYKYKLYNLV